MWIMWCQCKNITRVEVWWDYDGILYNECNDCGIMKNVHNWQLFNDSKTRWEYSPLYQYMWWELVWYSTCRAEGLSDEDDINLPENLLWWGRWINWDEEVVFRPIKLLETSHIEAILDWEYTNKEEYILAFKEQLWLRWK